MAYAAMSAGGASAKTHVIKDELNPDFSEWSCALELDKYLTHADQLDDHELHIKVLGLTSIAPDVSSELALATIESITVLGALHATKEIKSALADRIR